VQQAAGALAPDGDGVAWAGLEDADDAFRLELAEAALQASGVLELLERATSLAEKYGEAIIAISEVLSEESAPMGARVMRARLCIGALDSEAQN
jgi:hypothetical protein